jgi:hypothetical protein
MPPARTTLPHFSVSFAISLPLRFHAGIGDRRVDLPVEFFAISPGVFFGAAKPCHWLASWPVVKRGIHGRSGADIAAGAGAVLDHEGLTETIGQPLPDQARGHVDAIFGGRVG